MKSNEECDEKDYYFFYDFVLGVYTYSQAVSYDNRNAEDSMRMFDEIPDWKLKSIQFPQKAYKYGIVGIEQLCVSVSWNGKAPRCMQENRLKMYINIYCCPIKLFEA